MNDEDCGVYDDEDMANLLMRTLKSGWLNVWYIRGFMEVGEDTTD